MPPVLEFRNVTHLPPRPRTDVVYRLLPNNPSDTYFTERTDRNIGWITYAEQAMLKKSVVGVAGCGGMGGLIAATLVRAGVGEVRIADREVFDISNINRQFGAGRTSIGRSKALETASLIRTITNDTTLVVYPQGISEDTVASFTEGCDVVFDEIEFYAIGARVQLHEHARAQGAIILNCNTVGFCTFCFKYTSTSMSVEDALGISPQRARVLEYMVRTEPHSLQGLQAATEIEARIVRVFVPTLPEYCAPDSPHQTRAAFCKRLAEERRVSIIATNPPMASGFAADRGLAELLCAHTPGKHHIEPIPPMPGYVSFDALHMQARVVAKQWWDHDAPLFT
jgi:hypothetical protein